MIKNATIHARLDEQTKEDALRVFEALGLSLSDAITLYFKQVAIKNGIPFELTAQSNIVTNFDKISEYKKDDLSKVLEALPDSVDELWVFGSATTEFCRPDSDLDVCIVGNNISKEDRKVISHAPRRGMDLIDVDTETFEREKSENNTIYKEIFDKGLLIYKKGKGLING